MLLFYAESLLIICCISSTVNTQNTPYANSNDIKEIQSFITNGLEEIQYSNNRYNILLLGPSAVGKTTLSLLLTSNNTELISTDVIGSMPTGTYRIKDKYGLIGTGNVSKISDEYLPILRVDLVAEENLYDGPGFDGLRNATVDIASMFFTHNAVENTNYIKFVFLVNYGLVNFNGPREGFLKFAEQVIELVQKIENYKNAIAMVITKDDRYDLTDAEILNIVVVYFKQVRKELISGEISPAPYHADVIKFIDILLTQADNGAYEKLALFRTPDKAGPLSEIQRIQDCKEAIAKTIYNATKYIKVNITDFGYPLSDKSRINIYELTAASNKEIMNNVAKLGKEIINYYENRENEDVLLSKLTYMFDAAAESFNNLQQDLNTLNTPEEFLNSLDAIVNDLDIIISDTLQKQLRYDIEFLNFLQNVNNGSDTKIIEWMNALNVRNYINNANNYYIFLTKIYNDFAKYDYQKDTTLYNVRDLNNWGLPDKEQGIIINKNNFKLFTEKTGYPEYKNIILDDIKLKRINLILEWTLRNPSESKCNFNDKELLVQGEYVKISDVVSSSCFKNATTIKIYAINKIFMDANLNLLRTDITLSMIAPNWDVLGKHNITLGEVDSGVGKFPDLHGHDIDNFMGYGYIQNPQDLKIYISNEKTTILDKFDSINEYYTYCRNNLIEGLRADVVAASLVTMATKTFPIYNTLGFVKDLTGLEFQYYELKEKVDTTIFYESLLQRIEEYSKNISANERSDEYILVLNYLFTATSSKVITLKRNQHNLIIDIVKYIDLIYDSIEKYESLQKQKSIEINQENYKKELDDKIEAAMYLITEQIQPEIAKIFEELFENIENLIEEIKELQKDAEKNIEELTRKRDELQKNMLLRGIFGCVKIMGDFLGFLGPAGMAAGAIVNGAASVGEGLTITNITAPPKRPDLPAGVNNDLDKYYNSLKKDTEDNLDIMEDAVDDAIKEVESVSTYSSYDDIVKKQLVRAVSGGGGGSGGDDDVIKKYLFEMNLIKTDIIKTRADGGIEVHSYKEFGFKSEKVINETKAAVDKDPGKGKFTEALKHAGKVVGIANSAVSVYKAYKKDKAMLNEYDKAIEAEKERLRQLEAYEKMIYDTMIPMLQGLQSDLDEIANNWHGQTLAELEVSKWQTQSKLKDMQYEMNKATAGFKTQPDISHCFDKLNEAMTTMNDVYMRIESYKEQQTFFAYLTNMMAIKGSITVSDPKLQNNINTMDIIIDANIIMDEFTQATNAFQQYVFPFAHQYLEKYNFPVQMNGTNITNTLIESATLKLTDIRTTSEKYAATIDPVVDRYIKFADFIKTPVTKPFYVWKNVEYADTITRLLKGETVTVDANVKKGGYYNAVKFNAIDLYFRIDDSELQNQVNQDLNCYGLEITHLGNSYYKCNTLYYIISNAAQHITYTIAKNNNTNMPLEYNSVYLKLHEGIHMLSPYTLWNITLVNKCSENIPNLLQYQNRIDLELIGRGNYVDDSSNCNVNLDYYYQKDDLYIPTTKSLSNSQAISKRKYKFEPADEYGSWDYTPIKLSFTE